MFVVLGDFNFDLEDWNRELHEILIGWELYPKDNRSHRDLRDRPIDYMLVYAPGNITVEDDGSGTFSPLPLEISYAGQDRIYRLCATEGRHQNKETVFTTKDLKLKKIRSSAPLHGKVQSELALPALTNYCRTFRSARGDSQRPHPIEICFRP